MQLKEKLDDLDIELIYLEDRLHGEEGNRITRARKILEDISNQVDKPVKPEIADIVKIIDDRLEYYNEEDDEDEYLTDETKDGYYKTGALEALETLKEIIQKQFSV